MFFSENPFYRLGLHSRDEAAVLLAREEKLKREGEPERLEALRILLQEENRSEAEFYWLIGWEKGDAFRAARRIAEGGVCDRKDWERKSVHSRVIIELNEMTAGHMSIARLLEIEKDFDDLSPLAVAEEIEKDRSLAGFPALKEPWVIEMWKQDLLSEIGRAASRAFAKIPPADHGTLIAALGAKGKRGMVYFQLLSDFENRKSAPVKIPALSKRKKGKRNFAAWGVWMLLIGFLACGWMMK